MMKDLFGVGLSGLCLLHCLLTPVLLAFGGAGFISSWLGAEWLHYLLLAPISLLLMWSLPLSWIKHNNCKPLLIGAIGFSLLLISLVVPGFAEQVLAVVGGLAVIGAHLFNRRLLVTHFPQSIRS